MVSVCVGPETLHFSEGSEDGTSPCRRVEGRKITLSRSGAWCLLLTRARHDRDFESDLNAWMCDTSRNRCFEKKFEAQLSLLLKLANQVRGTAGLLHVVLA